MKKKIMLALVCIAMLSCVIMMRAVQTQTVTHMQMKNEIIVENYEAKPQKSELPFCIDEAGEYRIVAEWQVDKIGVQTGCYIANDEGEILYQFAAGSITVTSEPIWMEPGDYKIGLYYLGGSKQQLAFADMVGWEMDESEAIEWEERYGNNGTYNIDYDLTIKADVVGKLSIVIPLMLIILMLVIGYSVMILKGDDMKQNYDERQVLIRGRAYEYAFCTMIVTNSLSGLLGMGGVELPVSGFELLLISVMLGVLIYALYSIWNEGYFALNMRKKSMVVILILVGLMNMIIGIMALLQNGMTDIRYLNFLCGIMLLVICVTMLVKKYCKDREEE